MINIPKDEIDSFITNTKGIKWDFFLENNFIPSDIIIKHKKRIFVTGHYRKVVARQILIANMFKRNNEKMSTDLFEMLMGNTGVYVFGNIDGHFDAITSVFDLNHYLDNVQVNEINENYNNNFNTVHTLANIQHLGNEYSIKAFKKLSHLYKDKKDEMVSLFLEQYFWNETSDYKTNCDEKYVEFMLSKARTMYQSYFVKQESYVPQFKTVVKLFGIDEVIDRITPSKLVIHTFKYNNTYDFYKDSPEIADKIALKILSIELDETELKEAVEFFINNIILLAEKSSYSEEIFNKFIKNKGQLYSLIKNVDWQKISDEFELMTIEDREFIFSRTDIPDWFTNHYSAQLMHIIFLRQRKTNE